MTSLLPLESRTTAGRILAEALLPRFADKRNLMALPRGGVPVAPEETIARLRARVEQVVCLATPEPFFSIGQWYRDFGETSDDEVHTLLREAWGGGERE